MGKKRLGIFLAVSACLVSGCRSQAEIPVSAIESSSDQKDAAQENGGERWDDSGYGDAQMPEALKNFEIEVEGRTCRLPQQFRELSDQGWNYQGDSLQEVDSDSYLEGETFEKGGMLLTAVVLNENPDITKIEDCQIAGLGLDSRLPENQNLRAELPGGIILGESGEEDVTKAYGAPADRYQEEGAVILTYASGAYESVQLGFDEETGKLLTIDLLNLKREKKEEPEETADPEKETYREPEKMADTLKESVVEFGGDLYRLPAPAAAFEKNGWQISPQESERTVEGGQYGTVVLERDGTEFYTVVHNEGEDAADVSDCRVTEVSAGENAADVSMALAGGITLGMPEEKFLELAGEEESRKSQFEEEGICVYTFYRNEAELDYTEVTVDTASGRVCGLKVVCNGDRDLEQQILKEE